MSKGFGNLTVRHQGHQPCHKHQIAVDAETIQQQSWCQFSSLEDPRGSQGVQHPFLTIVMIAILATLGGARGWEDIELYAESPRPTVCAGMSGSDPVESES